MDHPISVAKSAVFKPSEEVHSDEVCGFSFSGDSPSTSLSALLESFRTTGFQATNIGRSIEIVTDMLKTTVESVQLDDNLKHFDINRESRPKSGCTIFLGFTSNLMSSGLRETFRFLVQHNLVDSIVTTAGGIEEDFIKCLAPTYIGDFELDGADLRKRGLNRIGNLIVPNNNYCKFEDWVLPIFDEMLEEQNRDGIVWTPSLLIRKLGQKIDNERSVYYWAARNKIPVFCPALTDGSIGDMLYFHSYKNPGLVLDILRDVRTINDMAVGSVKTGMIILGGGVVKHHICNANLMRNGADHTVFINTGQEFDGSDSGARPDEAVSWGKIKPDSKCVKVFCDATVAFPLIVAETFAKHVYEQNKKK